MIESYEEGTIVDKSIEKTKEKTAQATQIIDDLGKSLIDKVQISVGVKKMPEDEAPQNDIK